MKKSIAIQGINTLPNHKDGECLSVVNARWKNGALRPVVPAGEKRRLRTLYDILFIHKLPNDNRENFIGITRPTTLAPDNNVAVRIIWDRGEGDITVLAELDEETVYTVEQTGNILVFTTDTDRLYAIWKDNNYVWLGKMPELPEIRIKPSLGALEEEEIGRSWYNTSDTGNTGPRATGKYYDMIRRYESSGGISYMHTYIISNDNLYGSEYKCKDPEIVNDIYGFFEEIKGKYEANNKIIMLTDAYFIRYAFRLYDNSVINISAPILIAPRETLYSRWYGNDINYYDYIYNGNHTYSFRRDRTSPSEFHLYANIKHFKIIFDNIKFHQDILKWKDIISSVDIFMSPPLGITSKETLSLARMDEVTSRIKQWELPSFNNISLSPLVNEKNFNLFTKFYATAKTNIKDNSLFYLIKQIEINEEFVNSLSSYRAVFPTEDDDIPNSDVLLQKEQLKEITDNHTITGKNSLVFNKRTHLFDLKTKIFNGYEYPFLKICDVYGNYNGFTMHLLPVINFRYLAVEVALRINGAEKKVYVFATVTLNYIDYEFYTNSLYPFLSYPDTRATKMTFFGYHNENDTTWYVLGEFKLTKSKMLNLAYYMRTDDLRPIELLNDFSRPVPKPADLNENSYYVDTEKLIVSETSNPFLFPAINSYDFDNRILWVASNKLAVTDRSFGQFPLYIGTTGGIYLLQVSADASLAYSKIITPTTHSLPINSIAEVTPYGVAYITEKGVQIINGQTIVNISAPLELPSPDNICPDEISLNTPNHNKYDFVQYCREATDICYNHYEDELIVIQKHKTICFVYNFGSKMWYQSTLQYDIRAKNSYPEILVCRNNILKSLSAKQSSKGKLSIITRPLYFGIDEVKNMQRAIIRGNFYDLNYYGYGTMPAAAVMGSNDGVQHNLLRGLLFPPKMYNKNYKDFDLGLMARARCRNYSIVLCGEFDEKTEIHYIDFEVNDNYNNDKMR